jgi:hypothetical protein
VISGRKDQINPASSAAGAITGGSQTLLIAPVSAPAALTKEAKERSREEAKTAKSDRCSKIPPDGHAHFARAKISAAQSFHLPGELPIQ